MISVLILTKNEERDLAGALASVAWSDDVHVFDSCSTDATVEIARAAGAQVHSRAFDDYATHRNAALGIAFKHPWVFLLDADERPTPELCAEMQRVVGEAPGEYGGISPAAARLSLRHMAEARAAHAVLHPAGAAGAGKVHARDQ